MSTPRRTAYPRRVLTPPIAALLWFLRIYVLVAIPLVVYAFVSTLRAGN